MVKRSPRVQPIVRHFVDEIGPVSLAPQSRAPHIALAQPEQVSRREAGKPHEIDALFKSGALAIGKPVGEADHVGQFHGAFDQRMAGKDLLD